MTAVMETSLQDLQRLCLQAFGAEADVTDGRPFVLRVLNYSGPWQRAYWIFHPGDDSSRLLLYLDLYHTDGECSSLLAIEADPVEGPVRVYNADVSSDTYEGRTYAVGSNALQPLVTFPATFVLEALDVLFPDRPIVDCMQDEGAGAGFPEGEDIIDIFRDIERTYAYVASYPNLRIIGLPAAEKPVLHAANTHPWLTAYDRVRRRIAYRKRTYTSPRLAVQQIWKWWCLVRRRLWSQRLHLARCVSRRYGCWTRTLHAEILSYL